MEKRGELGREWEQGRISLPLSERDAVTSWGTQSPEEFQGGGERVLRGGGRGGWARLRGVGREIIKLKGTAATLLGMPAWAPIFSLYTSIFQFFFLLFFFNFMNVSYPVVLSESQVLPGELKEGTK